MVKPRDVSVAVPFKHKEASVKACWYFPLSMAHVHNPEDSGEEAGEWGGVQVPMVKSGDASMAALFTAKEASVTA